VFSLGIIIVILVSLCTCYFEEDGTLLEFYINKNEVFEDENIDADQETTYICWRNSQF
jgi:hypothetical protein